MDHQDFIKKLQESEAIEKQASIQRSLLLKKALSSDSADLIYKAQNYLQKIEKRKDDSGGKSMLLDPLSLTKAQGYRDKQITITYQVLRRMSRIPIVKAIIETRIEQVLNFSQPQPDKYSTGFVIRPKNTSGEGDKEKLTPEQEKRSEFLTNFILKCGTGDNHWHGDDFSSFLRKFVRDSLSLDQGVFEIVRNRKGDLVEYFSVDGATFRIADSMDEEDHRSGDEVEIDGYLPSHVQVYQGRIVGEFYPWELCFGIRNPQSDIYANGYGRSELEDLIHTVTSMLNADQYNANYFKLGSNPKGILKVTGNINEARIQEFKAQWESQMAGVINSHRMPVIEAEKMDFINTQSSNKDMEYGKYYEFLLKLTCACYKIDPSEIGFPLNGSTESKPMFEGNNEARLKYSRDRGLTPLLRYTQKNINKFIIEPLDKDYEFVFVGLDNETAEQEFENDIKAVQNWQTPNEIRRKRGMEDIEGGDIILNPILLQSRQMKMMGNSESNAVIDELAEKEEEGQEKEQKEAETDPFEKSFSDYWGQLMNE